MQYNTFVLLPNNSVTFENINNIEKDTEIA